MFDHRRIVAAITAFFFLTSQLTGCTSVEPRKNSDGGVKVAVVRPGAKPPIDPGSVGVVGRIRVENKEGTPLDVNTELAVYVLGDLSLNPPVLTPKLEELVRLDTKPFAPERDGSFRLILPEGRYYVHLVYRNKDVGLVSINPRAMFDIADGSS
jgi:hypothetical protein